MAEALGIASSIITLIEISHTIVGYLKDVKEAPKERDKLSKELSTLEIYLGTVNQLTRIADADDPWLATTQRLSGPFVQLGLLLQDLKKKLEPASDGIGKMKQRLLWRFSKENVEDALKKIERIKTLVIVAVQHDHAALSRAMNEALAIVNTKVDSISDNTKCIKHDVNLVGRNVAKVDDKVTHMDGEITQLQTQMQKDQDDEMLMRVIAWLTDLNFKSVQAEKLSQRVGDTGRWFLESQQFRKWVDGSAPSSCLWCPGNPGVGKTILASIIIDHLQSLPVEHEKKTPVLSIFCDYRSAAAQTVANLLCSVLKQLGQGHGFSSPTMSLYSQCLRDGTRPSFKTLAEVLSRELKLFDRVYIVLDALDEFTDDNRGVLINTMRSLGDNIHLLVTSRYIGTVTSLFEKDIRLDIQAADDDIKSYIKSRLSCGRLSRHIKGQGDLHKAILTGVAEKARGMFLLAGLHMDSLAQTTNRKILRDTLGGLPDNMANAYDKTLERVDSQGMHDRDLAYRIFGWVAFARRPLTVLELRHALAVEPGMTALDPDNLYDDDLLGSVCAGLVVMDWAYTEFRHFQLGGPIMRFVHYTTQEYFISRHNDLFPNIQDKITRTCLTYMSFDNLALPRTVLEARLPDRSRSDLTICLRQLAEKHPFLYYSSSCWAYHAKGKVEHSIQEEIIAFLGVARNRVAADTFRAVLTFHGTDSLTPSPLQFAAYHGLVHIMEALLNQGADTQGELLLIAAAQGGHLDMVKLLLSRASVDVNQVDPKKRCTPLIEAASQGHEEVVKAILESKHMNSLNSVDQFGDSALFWAISRSCLGVVRILLAAPGINVTLNNNSGRSPLAHAVHFGQGDIVGMLLKRGDIDPDARSPLTKRTPLFYAAELGHANIVEMLLQTGRVDVNSKDCDGCTAFMIAVSHKNRKAAEILLGHPGIDVKIKDERGKTAYSHANAKLRWWLGYVVPVAVIFLIRRTGVPVGTV
ncbi:uncharacterized protein ARMOST_17795 [Armillaria ostoyae]|uniref:Uncharacterized protein n=1 Tax=Armillaria ostoyae TaxID=47428 RepID=A0A284RZZ5_ARMOS|nr:uncharacterized protein ARMOST_17795 [Armillaria ostoyae]